MENKAGPENNLLDEEASNELALLIQRNFPLAREPYAILAEKMGVSVESIIATIRSWKKEGKLREISAVLEGYLLGHDTALVCGKVPEARLAQVAATINKHPTVTHNYERNHAYNIWFTIAVPFQMGLENHLKALARLTGVSEYHALRRTQTFKVGVAFNFKTGQNNTSAVELKSYDPDSIPEQPEGLIRLAQNDLPVRHRPFLELAQGDPALEEELLSYLLKEKGRVVRRYIGTFRHRKMGILSNGMTVFRVPESELKNCGEKLAVFPEVSHCYARNAAPGFPYSLYAMLHAPDTDALSAQANILSRAIGVDDYLVLQSPREFKKERLKYFLPAFSDWWQENQELAA